MRKFPSVARTFIFVLFSGLSAGCSDLAGVGSPASLQNIDAVFGALTFKPEPSSGVAAYGLRLWVITPRNANESAIQIGNLTPHDPHIKMTINGMCARDSSSMGAGAAFAAPNLLAWGQWLYGQAISQLEGRINALKKAADPPAYVFRQTFAAGKGLWSSVNCLVVQRTTAGPNKTEIMDGFTAILRKMPRGPDASVFQLAYVRADNLVALTAVGTTDAPASAQVDIAFSLHAARKDKGKGIVEEVAKFSFRPITVPVGQIKELCSPAHTVGNAQPCKWESDLIGNPPDTASALDVAVSVKETGSAADVAAKALAGLNAINTITKPSFETWLKKAIAESAK